MADEETQGQEDAPWWAPQTPVEPSSAAPASMGFDEPLVWPELPAWDVPAWDGPLMGSFGAPELPLGEIPISLDAAFDLLSVPDPPAVPGIGSQPDADDWWEPAAAEAPVALEYAAGVDDPDATVYRHDPIGGLGGGAGLSAPPPGTGLPESIWADTGGAVLVTTTMAEPPVYAEAGGPRRRRFGVRGGNAAVIALISLVSLVLMGMFLSVRNRDDVTPTDVVQQRPPVDEIAVTGPLNTVPFTPTTSRPGSIDIAGLVPVTEPTTTQPTTATTRPTAAATQPTTATTAAPDTTTTAVATTVTTKPDETPSSTAVRRTTTSFVFPTTTSPRTSTSRVVPPTLFLP